MNYNPCQTYSQTILRKILPQSRHPENSHILSSENPFHSPGNQAHLFERFSMVLDDCEESI
jgi:hypothetical protein